VGCRFASIVLPWKSLGSFTSLANILRFYYVMLSTSFCQSPSEISNYFDSISLVLTPDNRIILSKKPHKQFHRYKDSGASLASSLNCKTSIQAEKEITNLSKSNIQDIDCFYSENSFKPKKVKTDIPLLPTKKKFTRQARHKILAAAGSLEKAGYLPNQFIFFTGTLPGTSSRACEGLARYSRYLVNRLKQWLRDSGCYSTFNTWEFQKRSNVRGRYRLTPALHLHLVAVFPSDFDYSYIVDNINEKWFDILDDISSASPFDLYEDDVRLGGGSKSRFDKSVLDNCCKTIICEKSPAAYLSKYVGKTSSKESCDIEEYCRQYGIPLFYPSSWWSISNELRSLIEFSTASFLVRVNPFYSEQVFSEIADFVSSFSSLILKRVSPLDYPDYWYQSFYIPPDLYFEISEIIDSSFLGYQEKYSVSSPDAFIPPAYLLFGDWLLLRDNRYWLSHFLSTIPLEYSSSFDSSTSLSFYSCSNYLRQYYNQYSDSIYSYQSYLSSL
jgi:hypothetical protein